jgi:hypothetical protein
MSIHEIQVAQKFRVRCLSCNLVVTTLDSAGQAEEFAKSHIEFWSDKEGHQNYNHELEIVAVTRVGRQL